MYGAAEAIEAIYRSVTLYDNSLQLGAMYSVAAAIEATYKFWSPHSAMADSQSRRDSVDGSGIIQNSAATSMNVWSTQHHFQALNVHDRADKWVDGVGASVVCVSKLKDCMRQLTVSHSQLTLNLSTDLMVL